MKNEYYTFTLEEYARRNINYLERMVDKNNQPYFNIFWTDPISAVHDWPDICDVATRQLQAAVMIRHMTGKGITNEDVYRENFFKHFSYKDGLIYRPISPYTQHAADIDEQSLVLSTLVTLLQDERSIEIEDLIKRAIETLLKISLRKENYLWFPAFNYYPDGWRETKNTAPGRGHYMMLIRPILQFYKLTGFAPAFEISKKMINGILNASTYLFNDGTFHGHVHAHLGFLSGMVDYAVLTQNQQLLEKINKYYLFIRSQGTSFGWIPEETGKKSDCIGCETCGIMDFIQLSIMLAKNGYPEYWDDVERTVRNHLIESQFIDTDWMKCKNVPDDDEEISYKDIHSRMIGGFAGWSSPNHYLGYLEYLPEGWLQNINNTVINKYRIAQNCCGGSGSRALFNVWSNIAEVKDGYLIVNLHIDKKLKQAEIRCFKPYSGLTRLILNEDLRLKIRIPGFLTKDDIKLYINNEIKDFRTESNYIISDCIPKGSKVELEYPLPDRRETISIGCPGFQQYHYDIEWKGDTVTDINAHDNKTKGYSSVNKAEVTIFSGNDGPGKLYQRDFLKEKIIPAPAEILEDKKIIYF